MKIIGVTGKSGAGKSTFTTFLGERKNVGVIHLDSVINGIKEEKFQKQIKGRNRQNAPRILSTKTRYFINSHKISFRLFMALKKVLLKNKIQNQINSFKREGKDAVVIDGIHLTHMTNPKMFDSIVYIRRAYKKREESLKERDGISKMEILERDLPFKRKFSTTNLEDFDYVIDNDYGKEELRAASEKIYDEVVGVKTFDERYAVSKNELLPLKNIVSVIQKTNRRKRARGARE